MQPLFSHNMSSDSVVPLNSLAINTWVASTFTFRMSIEHGCVLLYHLPTMQKRFAMPCYGIHALRKNCMFAYEHIGMLKIEIYESDKGAYKDVPFRCSHCHSTRKLFNFTSNHTLANMKFTSAVLLSIIALVSASPAPQPNVALEARQSYGNCQVTGRGGLDVFVLLSHRSLHALTIQFRARVPADATPAGIVTA